MCEKMKKILTIALCVFLLSCEKDFDIEVASTAPKLVVEAYISNQAPQYTYVILSKSVDYFNPIFQSIPIKNAQVSITEGSVIANDIVWNAASKRVLSEVSSPLLPSVFTNGLYIDPLAIINPSQALVGKVGKYYKLDVLYENNAYTGITNMPDTVRLDSVTYGFPFVNSDNENKCRITNHYKDPDTLGNTYFYYWRNNENRNRFGWAGLFKSRSPGRDDSKNGEYIRITHPTEINYNDTITYMLTSVNRNTHNFWDSYLDARNNNGPFSTPVLLQNYISGKNVIGCFMGLSVSERTVITKP
jgi:Domain of unknown function (DUF4249)